MPGPSAPPPKPRLWVWLTWRPRRSELPVVTTHETGLCGWEAGGGLLVHPQVEELSRALKQVFSWSDRERQDRGQKLRQLVERRYSWQAVGPQWLELYSSLAG